MPEKIYTFSDEELARMFKSGEMRLLTAPTGDIQVEDHCLDTLIKHEKRIWPNLLGADIDVKPLPSSVTLKVRENLDYFGFKLIYMPKLDLGSPKDLKGTIIMRNKHSVNRYLNDLGKRYPNWRRPDLMLQEELMDHNNPRNLNPWFWGHVKLGNIDFPDLAGAWMAVENMPKPEQGEAYYGYSPMTEILGFKDRFNISWDKANEAIKSEKYAILSETGLSVRSEVRMLEVLEWNLIANREGWGKTMTFEWTNTQYRGSIHMDDYSCRLIIGGLSPSYYGAGFVDWTPSMAFGENCGFRVAIVLDSFS